MTKAEKKEIKKIIEIINSKKMTNDEKDKEIMTLLDMGYSEYQCFFDKLKRWLPMKVDYLEDIELKKVML